MRSTNHFFVRGWVGQEPKLFGKTAKVAVGTNRSWKDKKGEMISVTDWVTITILNEKIAAWAVANVKKGDPVFAECRIANGSYEKNGEKIYTTEIIANIFDSLVQKDKITDEDEAH